MAAVLVLEISGKIIPVEVRFLSSALEIRMKVTRHRKSQPLRHKIHMPDGIWTYQIGRKTTGGATIRNPDCRLTGKIDMSELTGWSSQALERAEFEGTEFPQVKPSDIRLLIENIPKGA